MWLNLDDAEVEWLRKALDAGPEAEGIRDDHTVTCEPVANG
jgi:hypothetical protein